MMCCALCIYIEARCKELVQDTDPRNTDLPVWVLPRAGCVLKVQQQPARVVPLWRAWRNYLTQAPIIISHRIDGTCVKPIEPLIRLQHTATSSGPGDHLYLSSHFGASIWTPELADQGGQSFACMLPPTPQPAMDNNHLPSQSPPTLSPSSSANHHHDTMYEGQVKVLTTATDNPLKSKIFTTKLFHLSPAQGFGAIALPLLHAFLAVIPVQSR